MLRSGAFAFIPRPLEYIVVSCEESTNTHAPSFSARSISPLHFTDRAVFRAPPWDTFSPLCCAWSRALSFSAEADGRRRWIGLTSFNTAQPMPDLPHELPMLQRARWVHASGQDPIRRSTLNTMIAIHRLIFQVFICSHPIPRPGFQTHRVRLSIGMREFTPIYLA